MVRTIAGTLAEVGLGRRPIDDIPAMLAARRRAAAGRTAPPHGLVLWSVEYDKEKLQIGD
jgi:tRNA pseudouridine38-40 synthase